MNILCTKFKTIMFCLCVSYRSKGKNLFYLLFSFWKLHTGNFSSRSLNLTKLENWYHLSSTSVRIVDFGGGVRYEISIICVSFECFKVLNIVFLAEKIVSKDCFQRKSIKSVDTYIHLFLSFIFTIVNNELVS
jgi:hypothetical protein